MASYESRVIAALMIILGVSVLITTIWSSVRAEDFAYGSLRSMGGLVFGVMVTSFGLKAMSTDSTKLVLVAGFIMVLGTAFATRELCNVTAGLTIEGSSLITGVVIPALGVVMGFVLSWGAGYVTGSKQDGLRSKMWYVIMIAFIGMCILMVARMADTFTYFGVTDAFYPVMVGNICYLIIFIYGLYAMMSHEIKDPMLYSEDQSS